MAWHPGCRCFWRAERMNAIKSRMLAIGVAVVLVSVERALEAAGLEYAFEDCAIAAVTAAVVVAAADLRR